MKKIIISIMLMFGIANAYVDLTNIGEPRINTNSLEAMRESLEDVKASLPYKLQDLFQRAVRVLYKKEADKIKIDIVNKTGNFTDKDMLYLIEKANDKTKKLLSGKTGREVIDMAFQVR